MMTKTDVLIATREQLADELAAACQSTEGWRTMPLAQLRLDVLAVLDEYGVDEETNVQSVRDIIRAFLDLPAESMPSAMYIDQDEPGSAWDDIRQYMLDSGVAPGVEIQLHADRPEWSNVIVTL